MNTGEWVILEKEHIKLFFQRWFIWLLGSWSWLSNPLIIRQRTGFDYQKFWSSSFLRYLIDNQVIMIWLFRLQNVYSQIKETRLKPLSKSISQPPPPESGPCLLPTSWHRRVLSFPVCVIIIGEDSFVITCHQHGIDWYLQCVFQGLVYSFFLEIILLFSICKEDSLYPSSRSRATMELSPHPNDIQDD